MTTPRAESSTPTIAPPLAVAEAPADDRADRLAALPKLGVGLSFEGALRQFVYENADCFDFLEVVPDSMWNDLGPGEIPRYEVNETQAALLDWVHERMPIIAHSVGLSIGSADQFDLEHVAQIAHWQRKFGCPWHSDHLSFNRFEDPHGDTMEVGITLPVPYDEEVLQMIIERVKVMQQEVPVPFLLENNVYYFKIPEQDLDEATFLNRMMHEADCGLLLDLHNVHVNAKNHGFDPYEFLEGFDLSRVVELHIAGGLEIDGVYMDAHSGPCPDEVWDLLRWIMPRTPNACGVVFEAFGGYAKDMGTQAIRAELTQARDIVMPFMS